MSIETQERVQKIIAGSGLCSRRKAEELVSAGRVTVNGESVPLGCRVDTAIDIILVDGEPLKPRQAFRYVALYKPAKVVSTMEDREGRRTISDFVAPIPERVYPIGRMDYNSEGLMLLTNDGETADHGSRRVDQVCHVWLSDPLNLRQERMFRDGLMLPTGAIAGGISLELIAPGRRPCYEIRWKEASGKNVRPMFKALGVYVNRLMRVQMGPIMLGDLIAGRFRYLDDAEVEVLKGL